MSFNTKLNVYFPINNLNPQGWISEFITPVLSKTGNNRSNEANFFYDSELYQSNHAILDAIYKNETDKKQDFIARRRNNESKKTIYLNGNFLDLLEIDSSYKGTGLTDEELQKYTLFMSQIKPYEAAFIQPYMKLQYGYRRNKKEDFTFIDFPFKQYYDLDFILKPSFPRAEGAGISSISVDNKFNLGTQINSGIDISFTFGSMKILTQEINEKGVPTQKAENMDSFPYGFSFMKLVGNLDTTLEVIRLEYGKKVANGFETVNNTEGLKSIIERKEKKVYLLNKISHTFNFDEKGVIQLGVRYMNFHDISMLSPTNIAIPQSVLNLLPEDEKMINKYHELKIEIRKLERELLEVQKESEAKTISKLESKQKENSIKEIKKILSKYNKTINLIKRSLKPQLTTVFVDQIKNQGQLFGINFNTHKKKNSETFNILTNIFVVDPQTGDFLNTFTYEDIYDINEIKNNLAIQQNNSFQSTSQDLLTRIFSRIFNSPYDEEETKKTYGQIMFFPLKALINAGIKFLGDESDIIPHMLFGSVLMKVGEKTCSINIGDLLVEVETFQKWYYDKFFKKDRLEYSFGAFVSDIITDLVPEILYRNRVGFDDKAPTTAIKQIQYYLKDSTNIEKIKENVYKFDNKNDLKDLCSLLDKNPTNNPKPLIYYGQINNQTTQTTSPLFSNLGISEFNFKELEDAKKGIPHIKIGADGGIFTNVSFNAEDFSKIRTALALESLAENSSRYFFFYYQLDIEMLGNNLFNYDGVVCVPSTPLGIDSEENDPGIAGYYKVKSTLDKFDENNNYVTTAKADWVFNPKSQDREKQKAIISPSVNSDFIIRDFLDVSVNDPKKYVLELLENDANTIINSQLQKLVKPNIKENIAKKDNNKKEKSKYKIDKREGL